MKSRKSLLYFIFLSMFFHFSCSKNDDSANPVDQSSFTGIGSDYFPVNANQSFKGTVNGSITQYDYLGAVLSSESWTGKSVESKIGASTTYKNLNVNPIMGYNEKRGRFDIVGYFSNSGDLIGLNINPDPREVNGLLLPKEFKIGQEWTVNSGARTDVPKIKVKAAEAMASYVTSSGKTYNNVVRLEVTSSDSVTNDVFDPHYHSVVTVHTALSGTIYLAKGTGLVDAKVENYSTIATGKRYFTNRTEDVYYKSVTKGTLGL